MGERYTRYSTANDVMKEFLIYGAELTEFKKEGDKHPLKLLFFLLKRGIKCTFYIPSLG